MSLKAGSVALAIALAAVAAPIGLAQNQEPPRIENPRIENPQNPESVRLAREVIEGVLRELPRSGNFFRSEADAS